MESRFTLVRVERHPTTEREALGKAALGFCRAAEEIEGIVRARFYWVLTSAVAILVEAETLEAIDVVMAWRGPKLVAAVVSLEDAGSIVLWEKWNPPGDGGRIYDSSISAVAASVGRERPDLESDVAPDGTVTIYFCDIVDSTPHNLRLGDEAWLELLRSHDDIVAGEIEGHDGSVVKTMGDGLMAIFPSARGALRASIAIQRELAAHNETAETPIRMRIGLHIGEPVRRADDFFGNDVNYAARVATAAGGDEILVSSVLHDLVASSGEFVFEERPAVALKGLDGEHVTWAVGWK